MANATFSSSLQSQNDEQLTLPTRNLNRQVGLLVEALSAETSSATSQLARAYLLSLPSEIQLEVLKEIVRGDWQISRPAQQENPHIRNLSISPDIEQTIKYHLIKLVYEQPFVKDDQRISELLQKLNNDGVLVRLAQISAFRSHLKITLRSALTPERYQECESSGLNIDKAVHYLIQAMAIKNGAISICDELQKYISQGLAIPKEEVAEVVMAYRKALKDARWPVSRALDEKITLQQAFEVRS
jgi:hypothetical protein